VVQIIYGRVDKLPHDIRLPVGLIESSLVDAALIQGNVQMALDLLAGPQSDIEESTFVFE
jgi:hypothetical protein